VDDEPIDEREIAADVADVRAAHASLVEHLRSLDGVEPSSPSRLPGWTVGHVLTHIARNADGMVSMLDGLPQYPHGVEGRNGDIEAGSTRTWAEMVDDVEATSAAVDERFAGQADWSGSATTLGGERAVSMLPFLRLREVNVHRVDLGLGFEYADLPARYLRKDLRVMEMLWRARKPMGMTTLPAAALALPAATRLAWLMGRVEVEGLDPALIF
jgi:maleylpyruvate isomerase